MTFKDDLRNYMPENRFQLFAFLFLGGILALYFADYFISKQLKTPVSVSTFFFLMILGLGVILLVWLVSKIARPEPLGTERWIIVIIVILSIIALFYYLPGIIPASFKGSMMSMRPFIGSIVGGGS